MLTTVLIITSILLSVAALWAALVRARASRRETGELRGWLVPELSTLRERLEQRIERGVVKCWGEDPWAGCAWTHPSGPQLVAINAPEGRIHFAGEHASVFASWMNGALESGNRAAHAVGEAAAQVAKV